MAKEYSDLDILELLQRLDAGEQLPEEDRKALSERTELKLYGLQITALPESVGQLANLQTLDLSFTKITALPDSIGQLANLQLLNLNGLQITALPESVGQLANLQTLNLWHTPITALPESLGQLANLQTLDLRNTKITALPESVWQLANLQTLNLWDTQITALPESIGQLANLQELDLSNTQITALPESVGQLANLQRLDLRRTQITALPESVRQLANLQRLDLRGTQITALPESVGRLANLQTLNLWHTQITALPESVGQLASLQTLNLGFTRITALPESVGELINLEDLSLPRTQIKTLPESVGRLRKLRILGLGGTKISELPEFVRGFSKLEQLYLWGTNITALPAWIGALPALQYLDLSNLTLPAIPESLALRGLPFTEEGDDSKPGVSLRDVKLTEQDRSIFLEHPELIPTLYQKEDLVPVRECRVIFLGDGESGKSYTIQRFRNQGKKETKKAPYLTSETPGVEILDYPAGEGEDRFTIHFWDFGGQQLLHSMHRCFLTENACYVVTVKTRETKANDRARFWLRNVTAFAPKSPILLFVNCWEDDDGRRSLDEPGLRQEFPMIREVVYCSAKRAEEGEFRKNVMDPVIDLAAASGGGRKKVPGQWVRVREAIEAESKENNYLDRARYHELCAENKIENEQAPELLSFFNELGVCFSYHRDAEKQELADYKLLNPVWLTNAVYAVIEEGRVHAREGRISRAEIERMLCNPAPKSVDGKPYRRTAPELVYQEAECPFILDVAAVHELCYPVNESSFFFPALCGADSPAEALSVPESFGKHLRYELRYQYLPDSVLHRLMVRCMRTRLFVDKCWLRGMVLSVWKLHRIIVRMEDDETLRIDVHSSGEHRAYELFWVLRGQIAEINRQMNLNAEEYILDGRADFLLEDVIEAAEANGEVKRRGVTRNARELLGDFYEESVIPALRVEDGVIRISAEKRSFTPCKQDNQAMRRALLEVYKHICPYCRDTLKAGELQVDHILPKGFQPTLALKPYVEWLESCGFDLKKPDYIENYFPAHGSCNRAKSNRINEFTLPYWHLIAAHRAKQVVEQMKREEKEGLRTDREDRKDRDVT